MKLSCHQPNFVPYLGYFEKIDKADIFAYSDTVTYSSGAFFNYNYFVMNGERIKVTVPARTHMSSKLKDIELADWSRYRKKLVGTIRACYAKAPYYKEMMPEIESILMEDYVYVEDLNIALTEFVCSALDINTKRIMESNLGIDLVEKNEDIIKLCRHLGCDTYLSGQGGRDYLDYSMFSRSNISLQFSSSEYEKVSVIDHLFKKGGVKPWRN